MTKKLIHALIAAVVLFGSLTFAPTAHATTYWRFITYYEGCGANTYVVGTATRDCSGTWSYSGQQSGHWKDVVDVSCTGGPEEHEWWYEYCGGNWVAVDWIGECSC